MKTIPKIIFILLGTMILTAILWQVIFPMKNIKKYNVVCSWHGSIRAFSSVILSDSTNNHICFYPNIPKSSIVCYHEGSCWMEEI